MAWPATATQQTCLPVQLINFLANIQHIAHTVKSQAVDSVGSLVTQPMLQRRPNGTELRSMDPYIQILCRFQQSALKKL